jgi:hypothetical protein
MTVLKFKVVSYDSPTDTTPYLRGYYNTKEVAERMRDDWNTMWSNSSTTMFAKVEAV